MADVKRYDRRICSCDYPSDEMELSVDGDYVEYEDYASLRASHDELRKAAMIAFAGGIRDKCEVPEYMELLEAAIAEDEGV